MIDKNVSIGAKHSKLKGLLNSIDQQINNNVGGSNGHYGILPRCFILCTNMYVR